MDLEKQRGEYIGAVQHVFTLESNTDRISLSAEARLMEVSKFDATHTLFVLLLP